MADVVSTGEAFSSTDALRERWPVTTEVDVGTALINGTRAGVAYAPSGGFTRSEDLGPYTISGIPAGGVSLDALEASVATDGTYEFAVTGATANTANGTAVYAVVSSGRITSLTTSDGSGANTLWGFINNPKDYAASASAICVKIGA